MGALHRRSQNDLRQRRLAPWHSCVEQRDGRLRIRLDCHPSSRDHSLNRKPKTMTITLPIATDDQIEQLGLNVKATDRGVECTPPKHYSGETARRLGIEVHEEAVMSEAEQIEAGLLDAE